MSRRTVNSVHDVADFGRRVASIIVQLLGFAFLAILIHELGHVVAGLGLGFFPARIVVSLMFRSHVAFLGDPLPRPALIISLLGGPLAVLLVAVASGGLAMRFPSRRGSLLLASGQAVGILSINVLEPSLKKTPPGDLAAVIGATGHHVSRPFLLSVATILGAVTLVLLWFGAVIEAEAANSRVRGARLIAAAGLALSLALWIAFHELTRLHARGLLPIPPWVWQPIIALLPIGLARVAVRASRSKHVLLFAAALSVAGILAPAAGVPLWERTASSSDLRTALDKIVRAAEALERAQRFREAAEKWKAASALSPQVIFFLRQSEDLEKAGDLQKAHEVALTAHQYAYSPDTWRAVLFQVAVTAHALGNEAEACAALKRQARIGWRPELQQFRRRSARLLQETEGCVISEPP